MDLQIPQGMLEDFISCVISSSVEVASFVSIRHLGDFYLVNFEIPFPQHLEVKDPKMKIWIDELKILIEDIEDERYFNAAKKRILGPDGQENPGFLSLKMMKNSFDREYVFKSSCYRNAGDRLQNSLWKELCRKESLRPVPQNHLLRAWGEYPQNHCKALNESKLHPCVNKEKQRNITRSKFSIDNKKPCVVLIIDLTEPSQRHGNKITSQLQDNSTGCNLNKHKHKHKETMPRDLLFQHKRKEIAQLVSFVVAASIMFLGLFFDMWIQPLHKERGPVSIWTSLLGLFGFMVFVWAVAITVLVGVPFSRMQSSVLIFWAILMHLKSASSISAVLVPMLGIIFLEVFARGKVENIGGK